MFGITKIHIGDMIDDSAIGFFGKTFVEAAIACLHMENRDMQPFGADSGKAGIRIPQNQQGVRFLFRHQLVGFGDDIPNGFAEIGADRVQIKIGGAPGPDRQRRPG